MTDTLHLRQDAPTSHARPELPEGVFVFDASLASNTAGPTVVVKRRKAMEHGAHAAPAPQEPGHRERAPRVFRVAPAVPDAEANAGDAQAAPAVAVPAPVVARRRRVPRPPVTIIRPGEDRNATLAGASGSRRTPASPALSVEPDLRFGQDPNDHRRLVQLQLEIEALRREAQALRKAEAAGAVRWIRKAIAKHGIDAAELGF